MAILNSGTQFPLKMLSDLILYCSNFKIFHFQHYQDTGPRSRRATPVSILTGRTKTSFSHLCISVITYLIGTKFATQLPASQGSLHSKFEGNRSSHFRDTSCQSFVIFSSFFFSSSSSSFRTLAKIAITSKRVLRSP